VIAVGDENARNALALDVREILIAGFHWIDAKISGKVLYKMPVKIVTVRFRKPRPGENTREDLAHFVSFVKTKSDFYDSSIFIDVSQV
jgi:hypothetical protein